MHRFRLALTFALGLAAQASALGAEEGRGPIVEIESLTWIQVRDRMAAGADTVIIPTGGTESNGPHMVTGKHNLIVRETARRIAERLGNALVAPVIAYVPEGDIGRREGHMAHPGTFSVPDGVFEGVLEAAAASARAHGARTIVFLGDSGGNQEPQRRVARVLGAKWAAGGVAVSNSEAYYSGNGGVDWLVGDGVAHPEIGDHAGVRDTSELMAVYPEGVDLSRAVPGGEDTSGDARQASARRGEKLLDLKVAAAVSEIRALQQRTAPAEPGFLARLYQLIFG